MLVKKLKLTNVRAFTEAEFEFSEGVNLLVGVNGVGKSTVLDSLRFLLANAFNKLSLDRENLGFDDEDVSIGSEFLVGQMEGEIQNQEFEYLILHSTKETGSALGEINQQKFASEEPRKARAKKDRESQIYNQTVQTGIKNDFVKKPTISKDEIKPIAVFFSPHRSIFSLNKSNKKSPFAADSLNPRELNVQDFANWILTRETLSKEDKTAEAQLKTIEKVVQAFLDNCRNLRAVKEPKPTLLIEKDGKTLDVNWLSEGERGVLSLALDLTVRLTTANPHLPNPHIDGKAVVLIDELDLHLHPKWQREIVARLEKTFPNCQFIDTTHSPQIVGEVKPGKIYLLSNTEKPFQPNQSLGMDTNWILKFLMQTDEEDSETKEKLEEIESLINEENYELAQEKIEELRKLQKGDSPKLVSLQAINSIYL